MPCDLPLLLGLHSPTELRLVVSSARYVQVPVGGVRFRADAYSSPKTRLVIYEGDHVEECTGYGEGKQERVIDRKESLTGGRILQDIAPKYGLLPV